MGNSVHFRVYYRMLLKSLQYPICIGLYLGQHKGLVLNMELSPLREISAQGERDEDVDELTEANWQNLFKISHSLTKSDKKHAKKSIFHSNERVHFEFRALFKQVSS